MIAAEIAQRQAANEGGGHVRTSSQYSGIRKALITD
jgi:hypothetical protein